MIPKRTVVVWAGIASIGALVLLARRSAAQPSSVVLKAPSSVPKTPTPATTPTRASRSTRTAPSPTTVSMDIVPLQDPRVPLTNTNDPAKDRVVTGVMAIQLDALHAPPQPTPLVRATAYLISKGSPPPTMPTLADTLYWAASNVNAITQRTFYS